MNRDCANHQKGIRWSTSAIPKATSIGGRREVGYYWRIRSLGTTCFWRYFLPYLLSSLFLTLTFSSLLGYKSLNRIQSRIFEKAYKSNENLLICAPTGAGKTNVAMMTVLHQLGQFRKKEVLQKDKFKIVYVAPMKVYIPLKIRLIKARLLNMSSQIGLSTRNGAKL